MRIIVHRRNTIAALNQVDPSYGVEIDIRSFAQKLILHHDPFVEGEDFIVWLRNYRHGTLILNVKEEGLEDRLLKLMREHGHNDFFFLDQSFPFIVKTVNAGEKRCAVRVSEYESVESALALSGRAEWIWIDCFTRFPLSPGDVARLHGAGFKLCLVSPELHGRDPNVEIPALRALLIERGITAEAVCTKRPELWRA